MKTTGVLLTVYMMVVSTSAGAGNALDIKPGMWETVTKMEMPGMPMRMPTTTFKHCVTAEDIAKREGELVHPASRDPNQKCQMKHHERHGNTMDMTMACSGRHGVSEVKGHMIFDSPTAYHGEFSIQATMEGGRVMHMIQHFKASRMGSCGK